MSNYLTEIIKTENNNEYRGKIKVLLLSLYRVAPPTHTAGPKYLYYQSGFIQVQSGGGGVCGGRHRVIDKFKSENFRVADDLS